MCNRFKIIFAGLFFLFCFRARSALAQVKINEFLPNPAEGGNEWVELYNSGSTGVGLSGWSLSDAANHTYSLDALNEIAASGFTVFVHPGEGWLNNSDGDSVILKDNQGVVIDTYSYTGSFEDDQSMGRCPDGSSNWVKFDSVTQGAANPTPTPASTPTSVPPTETPATPTPTATPTPKPPTTTPTPRPTVTPKPSPTPTELPPLTTILGESSGSNTDSEENIKLGDSNVSPPSSFLKDKKGLIVPGVMIVFGLSFVGVSVFLFLKSRNNLTKLS